MKFLNDGALVNVLPKNYLTNAISGVFRKIATDFLPTAYWLDKTPTPEMIAAAPAAAAIWPNAKFIFHAAPRVSKTSRQKARKFPDELFYRHCANWLEMYVLGWLDVREALKGRAIEVDQYYLAKNPTEASIKISEFLGLSTQECQKLNAAFTSNRPERTADQLDEVYEGTPDGWRAEQVEIFNEICLPVFAAYGYAEDGRYFASDNPDLAFRTIV